MRRTLALFLAPIATAAFALLASGCASGPSPEVMELMRQNAELKLANEEISRREIAEQEQQKKAEQGRDAAATAEAAKKAEIQASFNKDKAQVIAELTKRYGPHRQELLEAYGFSGTVFDYDIDDAALDGDVLYFEHRLVWKKPDASIGYVAIVTGYNRKKDEFVYGDIADIRNFTPAEFAAINGDGPKAIAATPTPAPVTSPAPSSSTSPSSAGQEQTFYQRNQQTIEQAAIGVGAAAATYGLKEWIESFFEKATQEAAP